MGLQIVILAAGLGKRMNSALPKVLQPLGKIPLLEHVIRTAHSLSPKPLIVVYGHQGDLVRSSIQSNNLIWVEQPALLGTAHALLQALPKIDSNDRVLVLYGDVPLTSESTLKQLIDKTPENGLGIITASINNPYGYGRIKRDLNKKIVGIVEEKDATEVERKIKEINTGIYLFPPGFLKTTLPKINNANRQQEYYLPDAMTHAIEDNVPIINIEPANFEEVSGVNDRAELAHLERYYQYQQAIKLCKAGVGFVDPARFDLRGTLQTGRDVTIDVNVIIEGNVVLGDECVIGANSILKDCQLGKRVVVRPYSLLEGATVADDCIIGPFARIRPDTTLEEAVHIGNFVEVKKSHIKAKSKVNHLTYIGDAKIGTGVNVGAGTVTCNYDGVAKHLTTIGDHVFVGSGSMLVAPVSIGDNVTIGAGSTITENVPADSLALARSRQVSKKGWKRK